ncbi:hypothetical protein [Evansella clarkii]|uniref:hypothetical protein n=1 Tax=Evansella clarkii TaxID=79879 RepID=UPI0014312165|nr:hypothetical protein [Evansella clarkii]
MYKVYTIARNFPLRFDERMTMMPDKKTVHLDALIKLPKLDADTDIKDLINAVLDDKKLIGLTKKIMTEQTNALSFIKSLSEFVTLRLNLPTKDDVANIAKLNIQVEEKIDSLEEKFAMLADKFHDLPEAAGHAGESDSEEISADIYEDAATDEDQDDELSFDHKNERTTEIDPLKQFRRDLILRSFNLQEQDLSNLTESLFKRMNKVE